jgi:hypothetical protein
VATGRKTATINRTAVRKKVALVMINASVSKKIAATVMKRKGRRLRKALRQRKRPKLKTEHPDSPKLAVRTAIGGPPFCYRFAHGIESPKNMIST